MNITLNVMYFKVLEYCANGSLLKYLRNHKSKFHQGLIQQVLHLKVLFSPVMLILLITSYNVITSSVAPGTVSSLPFELVLGMS